MSIIFREEMTTFDSFAVSLHLLSGTLGLVTFSVFSVVSVEVIVGVVVVVVDVLVLDRIGALKPN